MTSKMTSKNLLREQQAIEYLSKNECITSKIASELLDISDSTALRLLNDMTKREILEALGKFKDRKYTLKK